MPQRIIDWKNGEVFSSLDFGTFNDIKYPKFFAQTLDDLAKQMGLLSREKNNV